MCDFKLSCQASLNAHKQNVHFNAKVYGAKTLTETKKTTKRITAAKTRAKYCCTCPTLLPISRSMFPHLQFIPSKMKHRNISNLFPYCCNGIDIVLSVIFYE